MAKRNDKGTWLTSITISDESYQYILSVCEKDRRSFSNAVDAIVMKAKSLDAI